MLISFAHEPTSCVLLFSRVSKGDNHLAFPGKAVLPAWCILARRKIILRTSLPLVLLFQREFHHLVSVCELLYKCVVLVKQTFTKWPYSLLWGRGGVGGLIYATEDPENNTHFHLLSSNTHFTLWFCLTRPLFIDLLVMKSNTTLDNCIR